MIDARHLPELVPSPKQSTNVGSQQRGVKASHTCQLCGAWLGSLGLESTFTLYIEHIVTVFRELRRVLRSDATCWVNLGDSYHTGASGCGHQGTTGQRFGRRHTQSNLKSGCTFPPRLKPKDLCMIPHRVAIALQEDDWWVRMDVVWNKSNSMPESVGDRPTKSHEYVFLLSKSQRYYYDADAIKEPASLDTHARYARGRSDHHKWAAGGPCNQTIAKSLVHMRDREPGVNPKCAIPGSGIKQNSSFSAAVKDTVEFRNKRSVWTVSTCPTPEAHFATYPVALVEPCILAGCPEGGTVLDPFAGAGTTGLACLKHNRRFIGLELNPQYINIAYDRARNRYPLFVEEEATA